MTYKHPGWSYPRDDGGKYQHPWLRPLPAGKARIYDLMQRSTTTLLIAFTAYGFFEVGRGCYHIIQHNRAQAAAQVRVLRLSS